MYIALAGLVGVAVGVGAMWCLWQRGRRRAEKWQTECDLARVEIDFWKVRAKKMSSLLHDTLDDLAAARLELAGMKFSANHGVAVIPPTAAHRCPDDANALRDEARREGWPEAKKPQAPDG